MNLNTLQETSLEDSDKPPSELDEPPSQWLVAVIANVKGEAHGDQDGPEDADAEYDRPETIQAIRDAIEYDGHRTVFLNADANLPFVLREVKPDICFNIAEGKGSDITYTRKEAEPPQTNLVTNITWKYLDPIYPGEERIASFKVMIQ